MEVKFYKNGILFQKGNQSIKIMNTANGVKLIRSDNADEDVEWITIKGTHIPIKKGQSKEEAVKEFFEKSDKKTGQHGFKKVSGGGFEQEYSNGNYVKVDPDNKVYEVTVWDEKKQEMETFKIPRENDSLDGVFEKMNRKYGESKEKSAKDSSSKEGKKPEANKSKSYRIQGHGDNVEIDVEYEDSWTVKGKLKSGINVGDKMAVRTFGTRNSNLYGYTVKKVGEDFIVLEHPRGGEYKIKKDVKIDYGEEIKFAPYDKKDENSWVAFLDVDK